MDFDEWLGRLTLKQVTWSSGRGPLLAVILFCWTAAIDMLMLLLPGLELVSWIRESDDRLTVETGCNQKQDLLCLLSFFFFCTVWSSWSFVWVSVGVYAYLYQVLGLLWQWRLFRSSHRQLKTGAVEEHLTFQSTIYNLKIIKSNLSIRQSVS